MTNLFATKYAALNQPNYTHFKGADSDVSQLIRDAALTNFFSGMSVGTNGITGDKIDGLTNRHATYQDKKFFEENGFYPNPTAAWVA